MGEPPHWLGPNPQFIINRHQYHNQSEEKEKEKEKEEKKEKKEEKRLLGANESADWTVKRQPIKARFETMAPIGGL